MSNSDQNVVNSATVEQATTSQPQVRVTVQGPPLAAKSAIASRIRLAMEDIGVDARHHDPKFEELSYGERQNKVQVFRPEVVIHERTDAVAFTELADEFRRTGEILAQNPGEATASILQREIGRMEAMIDEMRTWTIVAGAAP